MERDKARKVVKANIKIYILKNISLREPCFGKSKTKLKVWLEQWQIDEKEEDNKLAMGLKPCSRVANITGI